MSRSSDLKKLIDQWVDSKKTRSPQLLARKAGVPYNTIRRISLGETEPECYTAMAILSIVASPEQTAEFLEVHFPKVLGVFGKFSDSATSTFFCDAETLFKDAVNYLATSVAFMGIGSKEMLRNLCGEIGLAKIEHLCDEGILRWDTDDFLRISEGREQFLLFENKSTILDACGHILEWARPSESRCSPLAILANVTTQERKEIKEILDDALCKISQKIRDSKDGDEIIAISYAFLRLLTKE